MCSVESFPWLANTNGFSFIFPFPCVVDEGSEGGDGVGNERGKEREKKWRGLVTELRNV